LIVSLRPDHHVLSFKTGRVYQFEGENTAS